MENLIVVTGYGQFAGHEVNASGEAVKLLPEEIEVGAKKYQIKKIEVSVEYEDVDKKVDEIWSLKPHLVIHCGELNCCRSFVYEGKTIEFYFKAFTALLIKLNLKNVR